MGAFPRNRKVGVAQRIRPLVDREEETGGSTVFSADSFCGRCFRVEEKRERAEEDVVYREERFTVCQRSLERACPRV